MNDGHKLELETPEIMKLFGNTKKINISNKEWRCGLEVVEVDSVKCNLVDNQVQNVMLIS